MTAGPPIRVLVVDDSAVVRQFMTGLIADEPDMVVETAADPVLAEAKLARERPDVILLDLEMPRMDGLTYLRTLMRREPIPVVVFSSHAQAGTAAALGALLEGAVDVVAKPGLGLSNFLASTGPRLLETLRSAAKARLPGRFAAGLTGAPQPPPRSTAGRAPARSRAAAWERVVAIGASTGGPEALRSLFSALPADAPPLLVVQHIPPNFTAAFAKRLDQVAPFQVKEAADGDLVLAGRALIAPGDRHLSVAHRGGALAVTLDPGPPVNRHRPSADVLFRSLALVNGPRSVGIVLTGMGSDGAEGLLELRRAGARTLAQDESTAVVFGMPRAAIERGAADEIIALDRLPERLLEAAAEPVRPRRPR